MNLVARSARRLEAVDSGLGSLVQVLDRQPKHLIRHLVVLFIVSRLLASKEHARVQHLLKRAPVASLELGLVGRPALPARLVRNLPVRVLGVGHALDRLEHVPLRDGEGLDENVAVAERVETGLATGAGHGQAEQRRNCATNLRPGRGCHERIALVKERHLALSKVEAVAIRDGQAPLVPEPGNEGNVGALAEVLDLLDDLGVMIAKVRLRGDFCIPRVASPFVGEDPRHTGIGGCLDQLGLLGRRGNAEGDDERILASKSLDQSGGVAIVDRLCDAATRRSRLALGSGQGRDGVLAGFEELPGDVAADVSSRLALVSRFEA